VLSQYLTAIQSAGSQPPQETGLTCNSWYGKFHLEMHWWHAAHFALWNRPALLRRSLAWYRRILPIAREIARRQGYEGVRWPKMVGPDGRNSPSSVGRCSSGSSPIPLLLAELCFQAARGASSWNSTRKSSSKPPTSWLPTRTGTRRRIATCSGRGHSRPGNHPARETWNPTFELAYWRMA